MTIRGIHKAIIDWSSRNDLDLFEACMVLSICAVAVSAFLFTFPKLLAIAGMMARSLGN